MRKKLLILAPMFAVLAFMVATAVAEASPHYYVNGVKLAAGKKSRRHRVGNHHADDERGRRGERAHLPQHRGWHDLRHRGRHQRQRQH